MNYHYDKANHPTKPDNESIWMIRIIGISFIIFALIEFLLINNEFSVLKTLLFVGIAIVGAFQLIFPRKVLRSRRKKGVNFVNLEANNLQWRLGRSEESINLDEVEHLEKNVGEIIFIKKNQQRLTLPTYQIENKEKFEEIRNILTELIKS